MTTQGLDWRALRRELFSSPRPRTSQTFQHTDIFGAILDSEQHRSNNPTNQHSIGQIIHKTPKRVRENDTTRSFLLNKSEIKNERTDRSVGKKTFQPSSSIALLHEMEPSKPNKVNPHRIPDHKNEWFYSQTSEPAAPREAKILRTEYHGQQPEISPHRQMKQEEMYRTEIAQNNTLSPDGSKLNLIPRRMSEMKIANMDRSFNHQRNATEMRLKHNESNVLNEKDYQSKLHFPIKPYTKPKKDTIVRQQTTTTTTVRGSQKFNPSEVNRIKRLNHNFSDVFGLEYGAREALQDKKSQYRNLSSQLDWTNVDSVLYEKDIGSHHKDEKKLNKSRSRILDQKSSMDTHAEYDKPIIKLQRLTHDKTAFQRGLQKKKKNW